MEFRLVGFSGQYAGHKTSISGFKVIRRATAFDTWVEAFFTPAEQVAAAITGPLDDADGDGANNVLEWASGFSPRGGGAPQTAAVLFEGEVVFNYTRSVSAVNAGVVFAVEWSDTLAGNSWGTAGVVQQILSDNGTVQQMKATVPAGTSGHRFVRLKINAAP